MNNDERERRDREIAKNEGGHNPLEQYSTTKLKEELRRRKRER